MKASRQCTGLDRPSRVVCKATVSQQLTLCTIHARWSILGDTRNGPIDFMTLLILNSFYYYKHVLKSKTISVYNRPI